MPWMPSSFGTEDGSANSLVKLPSLALDSLTTSNLKQKETERCERHSILKEGRVEEFHRTEWRSPWEAKPSNGPTILSIFPNMK